jgi:hypothetical protein
MDENLALREVQLADNEVGRRFYSVLKSSLRKIGYRATYCSIASGTFEGLSRSL